MLLHLPPAYPRRSFPRQAPGTSVHQLTSLASPHPSPRSLVATRHPHAGFAAPTTPGPAPLVYSGLARKPSAPPTHLVDASAKSLRTSRLAGAHVWRRGRHGAGRNALAPIPAHLVLYLFGPGKEVRLSHALMCTLEVRTSGEVGCD
ncbi:hypothetical protein PSPO01_11007 [Paraphaeosphaeria sporulosa]